MSRNRLPQWRSIQGSTRFATRLNLERPYSEPGLLLGTSAFTANGWAGFLGTELAALNSGIEMDRVMCFLKLPSEKISNVLNMEWKVIHDHHAGKKQNISSGFSVFLSVGHLGKRRWITSEKRRSFRRQVDIHRLRLR